MELDKRIMSGKKPLTAFDVMESKFIGTDCYFSDNASDYGDCECDYDEVSENGDYKTNFIRLKDFD